jgi:simple sugar transport system ATP-binding protein
MTSNAPMPDAAVRMAGIEKRFGACIANRGASLEVRRGEVHALVGENGAGKSTLMKVLSGTFAPDAGRIEVLGRDVTGWSTKAAIAAGIGMVHQHFMLVSTLTVAENVVLGHEPVKSGMLDRARARRDVEELSARTGLAVDPDRLVADLSVGEAQRVEILKTLYRGARVLLLDEPTAVLSPPEVGELWKVLSRVRDEGTTIVVITHKLDEVMEISDSVTVMRQGQTIARSATSATTPGELARAMVGRDVDLDASTTRGARAPRANALLETQNLIVRGARVERAVNDVSLRVAAGEILGIAGVEGNGQTELVEAIAGLRDVDRGRVLLGGEDVTALGVRARARAGLAHVPADRHRRGLVLDYSVADNLILGRQHAYARRGVLDRAAIERDARARIARFGIEPRDPALPVRALSGGNQQKVVIARELSRDYSVLLAVHPTRGVDVGAIEFIHGEVCRARDAGKAVLLVSSELRELLALSDRIAVMYGGRVNAIFARDDATEEMLGRSMTGVEVGA